MTAKQRRRYARGSQTFNGRGFGQTYLGYKRSDPRVFGKKWNTTKARLLGMLSSKEPTTISSGTANYQLPPIDVASDWRKTIEACKN